MKKNQINLVLDKNMNVTSAVVSREFARKASIFGTNEYEALKQFRLENTDIEIVIKHISKNSNKKTGKYMTIANMRSYVANNKSDLVPEFDRQVYISKSYGKGSYHYVVAWFKKTFTNEDDYLAFFGELASKETAEANSDVC